MRPMLTRVSVDAEPTLSYDALTSRTWLLTSIEFHPLETGTRHFNSVNPTDEAACIATSTKELPVGSFLLRFL
jgi:hypothetical protein